MISFKISAPGKLILYGEHAVVYGKTALAASLDLRTTLKFEELKSDELNIHLSLPKISFLQKISIKTIEDHFFGNEVNEDNSELLYARVKNFAENIGFQNLPQRLALEAFFFLFISVIKSDKQNLKIKPFSIHIDTKLSVSSGLGSSASFAVCLTTCFIHYVNIRKNLTTTLDRAELDAISKYALNCEKIMHGNPSGIDNAVCTYGSIVEFRKDISLRSITGTKKITVLLVDTKVPRSTKALVGKVAELKDKYPKVFEPILESISNVSLEALNIIEKIKEFDETDLEGVEQLYQELLTLVDINQNLLTSCQVSHPTIERICAEAKKHSLRAKLTGAGGGGYAYVLLPPGTSEKVIAEMSDTFLTAGFGVTLTNLGGPGVKIES